MTRFGSGLPVTGGQRRVATQKHHKPFPRLVAAGAAFALVAAASTLGPVVLLDQMVTTGLQHAMPHARTAHVAARVAYLGNAGVMISALTVIGLGLWLVGDTQRGIVTLVLTAAILCASLSAGLLEHVIAHPGPPETLKLHFPRQADDPLISLMSIGHAAWLIVALVVVRFVVLLLTPAGRNAAAWLPLAIAVSIGVAALGLRHVVTGLPPALAGWLNAYAAYGYPSGHVARTTVLVSVVLRRVPVLGGLVVAVMMTSLVYLGDHWLSEALGGCCLGWIFVEALRCRWPLPRRSRSRPA